MTDRGLPIVDGAPACPFVAFDDDREERASGPDQRHRCYAELRPAPRAAAHQDAYCLSSGFALCPTFQDWARREGARVRDEPPAELLMADDAPRRNPARGWAAPPPWLGGFDEESGRAARGDERLAEPPDFLSGRGRAEAGLSGSLAHQIALDGAPPSGPQREAGFGGGPGSGPGGGPGRGSAYGGAGAAGGWAGQGQVPGRLEDGAALGGGPKRPAATDDDDDDDDTEDDAVEHDRERRLIPARGTGQPGGLSKLGGILPGRGRPKVGDTRPRRRGSDFAGPPWERPHRYEAYPTLRTRMGLPAVPRVVLLAGALVLAMVGLFMLPGLLGLGSPGKTPGPSIAANATVRPSATAGPSIAPGPTGQTYLVLAGDTMSKIAGKLGVPLADLIAANKDKYPNPDKIVAGDTIIIPAPLPSGFTDAGTPAPTKAPATKTPTPTATKK